jgi:hypothetical protein
LGLDSAGAGRQGQGLLLVRSRQRAATVRLVSHYSRPPGGPHAGSAIGPRAPLTRVTWQSSSSRPTSGRRRARWASSTAPQATLGSSMPRATPGRCGGGLRGRVPAGRQRQLAAGPGARAGCWQACKAPGSLLQCLAAGKGSRCLAGLALWPAPSPEPSRALPLRAVACQSIAGGRFFSLKGTCVVEDRDGDDGALEFKVCIVQAGFKQGPGASF